MFKQSLLTVALGTATLALSHSALALSPLPDDEIYADIKIAYDADPVSMDPQEQLSGGTLQMANLLFDPLVRFDEHLEVEPRLAKRWEQIDENTLRFTLRDDVEFHSGNKMTADDVIFSFERILTSGDFKGLFTAYDRMEKVDDYTVDVITKQPYPLVLANMTYLFVMDKDFYTGTDDNGNDKSKIEKSTGTFASTNVSGTGRFRLLSRQQGVESVYDKYRNHWDKMTFGNIRKLTLVPIKENATRVSALLSGGVDWIYPVPPTDLDRVRKADGYELYSIPSDRIIFLELNQEVVEQFKDVRVRQAVVHAINNEGIVEKIMRGFATPAGQFSPEGYSGHDSELVPRYDLEKAKALMAEAGYADGFTVTMISPNNRYVNDEKIAQAVAAMLAKINIKVNLTTMPKAQYWDEFDKCAAGIQLIGWSSDTGDSANYSEYLSMTRNLDTGVGQYNCNGNSNPDLDALVNEANAIVDPEKRSELLKQASKIEYEQAIVAPLHWQNLNWGYKSSFTNFPENVNLKNFPLFGDIVIEK